MGGKKGAGGGADGGGGGGGGDGGGGGLMCMRVIVAIVATILIIGLLVLLILLGVLISGSAGKVAKLAGEEDNDITDDGSEELEFKFTWLSWVLVFLAVLVAIELLAQFAAFAAVVCMNRCLVCIYAIIQIFFAVIFLILLILGIVVIVFTKKSEAEKVTSDGEVEKVSFMLMLLTKLARGTMNEQYSTGLGGITGEEFEQEYECCGLVSPDEYWDIYKRMHDPTLELVGKKEDEAMELEAMKTDPGARTGGSLWHIKCLQDNNPDVKDLKKMLDVPLCYAPKSCCREKENNDGCNDASITLRELHVNKTSQLQALLQLKHDAKEVKALWVQLRAKQTALGALVKPLHKEQMFDESCLKKFREPMFGFAVCVTVVSGLAMLVCIAAVVVMCCLRRSM